ncbi:hypothetical protein JCM19236_4079 [Vibrio sp. JCM 19236]|nr:hypothetical protein JCM19236_4079 [Vibrio sp. JCM 19236]
MSRLIFIFINILLLQDANADAQIQPVPPRPRPTVGMCHLEVLSNNGIISFGNNYQETANAFRLHVDDRKRRIKLKLEDIEVNEVAMRRGLQAIRFQVDAPDRYEGSANYWRRGIELSIDELSRDKEIEIQTRIAVPKMKLKAGDYEVRTRWQIECY